MNHRFVFDPRPDPPDVFTRLAPRLATLDGAVVAIVDNGKTNAGALLSMIVEELRRTWAIAGVVQLGPPSPGYGGRLEDVVTAAEWATVAIAGVGDCGSCSSGSALDALLFEERGIPAVPVVTRPFMPTATSIARLRGVRDYTIVAIDHPIASLHDAQLIDRARSAARAVAVALTTG